ncbi:hypothetical protein CB1_000527011 [Camelus ferus]|nr:hypothetical protein CB1_000527011 [Camelus ferus]
MLAGDMVVSDASGGRNRCPCCVPDASQVRRTLRAVTEPCSGQDEDPGGPWGLERGNWDWLAPEARGGRVPLAAPPAAGGRPANSGRLQRSLGHSGQCKLLDRVALRAKAATAKLCRKRGGSEKNLRASLTFDLQAHVSMVTPPSPAGLAQELHGPGGPAAAVPPSGDSHRPRRGTAGLRCKPPAGEQGTVCPEGGGATRH